jgi:cell wall-associated NlpC family hydrolase
MVWGGENSVKIISRLICVGVLAFLTACSSTPTAGNHGGSANNGQTAKADNKAASQAAKYASKMVGKPYLYGGSTPSGFDCSGLVQYSYQRAGVSVPRTTRSQLKAGIPVSPQALREGDLVFFDQEGRKYSHVGIYIGDGRFVHAPSSGKTVRVDRLDKRYWQKHFTAARRM